MDVSGVDFVAVVVAAVVGFAFGAGYYMVLSKQWIDAVGKSEAELKTTRTAVQFAVAILAQLVMAFVLCWFIVRLGATTWLAGAKIGAWAWLGFTLTTMAVSHGFEGAKRPLTVINGAHWFGVLVIQGLLIGAIT